MHKILSQVEILGSPIMLGSSLISGLSTFLAEPAKARNPSEFARGVGTGSVTLVKMASFGILTFIGQVCPLQDAFAACLVSLSSYHISQVQIISSSCMTDSASPQKSSVSHSSSSLLQWTLSGPLAHDHQH